MSSSDRVLRVAHVYEHDARKFEDLLNQLLERIVSVDNKALEGLLKELGKSMDRPRVNLLKAELDAIAKKTHSPRFWAKEVA